MSFELSRILKDHVGDRAVAPLAAAAGVDRSQLTQNIQGIHQPSLATLLRIHRVLPFPAPQLHHLLGATGNVLDIRIAAAATGSLRAADELLQALAGLTTAADLACPRYWQVVDAVARKATRGAHYRVSWPAPDDASIVPILTRFLRNGASVSVLSPFAPSRDVARESYAEPLANEPRHRVVAALFAELRGLQLDDAGTPRLEWAACAEPRAPYVLESKNRHHPPAWGRLPSVDYEPRRGNPDPHAIPAEHLASYADEHDREMLVARNRLRVWAPGIEGEIGFARTLQEAEAQASSRVLVKRDLSWTFFPPSDVGVETRLAKRLMSPALLPTLLRERGVRQALLWSEPSPPRLDLVGMDAFSRYRELVGGDETPVREAAALLLRKLRSPGYALGLLPTRGESDPLDAVQYTVLGTRVYLEVSVREQYFSLELAGEEWASAFLTRAVAAWAALPAGLRDRGEQEAFLRRLAPSLPQHP